MPLRVDVETQKDRSPNIYMETNDKSANTFMLDSFIHLFAFISVLLIGADKWGIDVGVNLRLDQLFLVILSVLIFLKNGFYFSYNPWIISFLLFSFISVFFAVSMFRGALYFCSIIYNVIFLFYGFTNYIKLYGIKRFIRLFRMTLYVQFAILLLQFLLKAVFDYELSVLPSYGEHLGVLRFNLWFYEPSYLATYLSFWFALSLYMFLIERNRGYWKDILMVLAMFLISTATTGFLAIILVCVTVYLIWICKSFSLNKLIFPCIVLIGFIIFRVAFSSVYEVFFGRLFDQSLDSASGGRISAWKETWDVFLQAPLFGVGPGNYGLFLGEEAGTVPSNVTLELMATLGIFATLAFYGLSLSLCIRAFIFHSRIRSESSALLAGCAIGLLIFTVVLQANQGYLRLYHWMFFGILNGGLIQLKGRYKNSVKTYGRTQKRVLETT